MEDFDKKAVSVNDQDIQKIDVTAPEAPEKHGKKIDQTLHIQSSFGNNLLWQPSLIFAIENFKMAIIHANCRSETNDKS